MATTTYDPLKDVLKDVQTPQQPGIVTLAGAAPAPAPTPTPAPTMPPASAPAPKSTAIVGAQSAQLGAPMGWEVTPDQTVEGRIDRIINGGSPILERAKARAVEDANARGLANSSIAVTAGQAALYDAALPIAQADAATSAKAAGYNADQTNQFAVKNTDYENQFKLQDKANQQEKDIAIIQRETQIQLSNLDAQNKLAAQQLAQQNDRILQTNAQANQAFQTAMSAVNNIQNNNQMDANTKTQAIAQIWRDLQAQLRVMGSVAGLDLTSQLNFANYPGFDGNGNFVGFGGGGGGGGTGPIVGGGGGLPAGIPSNGSTSSGTPLPAYDSNGAFINWSQPGVVGMLSGRGVTLAEAYQEYEQWAATYGQPKLSPADWYAARNRPVETA